MISKSEVRELIEDVFEEEALAIGGLVETHPIDDEVVQRLMQSLSIVRKKALLRVEDSSGLAANHPRNRALGGPHPAIEEFLVQIGRW